jgi:DNA-directed RNA polymerase beta' subunit
MNFKYQLPCERTSEMSTEVKRLLTPEEIEDIVSVVKHSSDTRSDSRDSGDVEVAVSNARESLRLQLPHVQLYPSLIPKFKQEIEKQYYRSLLQPGEMVGVIAASSIGEQNTQASLNSFHSSGSFKANLTGGLARLTELMNATENIKTPSLTIYFNKDVEQTLENVRRLAFSKLMWVELDNLVLDVSVSHKTNLNLDEPINSWYQVFHDFIDSSFMRCEWLVRISLDPYKLWRHQITLANIVKKIQEQIDTQDKLFFAYSHESVGLLDIWIEDSFASFQSIMNLHEHSKLSILINNDSRMHFFIHKTVLPSVLSTHLSGVSGIQDCYYTQVKREWRVDTKGGSLKELLLVDCVDGLRSRSNNLHEIHQMFGIEATKQFLRDEFGSLIKVNPRHLELLIDSMTVSGNIQRVTRNGIDRKQVGTIAKASFEQPVDNFLISASSGEVDPLKGVSSAITIGKLAEIGTGFMELYMNQPMIEQHQVVVEQTSHVSSTPHALTKSLTSQFQHMNINLDEEEVVDEPMNDIQEFEF